MATNVSRRLGAMRWVLRHEEEEDDTYLKKRYREKYKGNKEAFEKEWHAEEDREDRKREKRDKERRSRGEKEVRGRIVAAKVGEETEGGGVVKVEGAEERDDGYERVKGRWEELLAKWVKGEEGR